MSNRSYLFLMNLCLILALAATALVSVQTAKADGIWVWIFLGAGFLGVLAGSVIAKADDGVIGSLVGLIIAGAAYGLLFGPFGNLFTLISLVKVSIVVLGVVVLMMTMGVLFPSVFDGRLGAILMAMLCLLIVGNLARIILPIFHVAGDPLSILDWVGAGVFSLYIAVDTAKAMSLPHTANNAIDSAVDLLVDVMGLLINLLAASGERKKSN